MNPGCRNPLALSALTSNPPILTGEAYAVAVDVVGNIGTSLSAILALPPAANDWDLAALAERRAAMFERLRPSNEGFGPKGALAVLREVLPSDGIMTCDVGAHTHLIGQMWPTPRQGCRS